MVLKNHESELSYILAELSNMCMKESCFQDYCKVSSVVPVCKNFGKRSMAKNNFLLFAKSKIFKKLINNNALTLPLLLNLLSRKLESWFVLWSFFLLKLLFISVNLPHCFPKCSNFLKCCHFFIFSMVSSFLIQLQICCVLELVGLLICPGLQEL